MSLGHVSIAVISTEIPGPQMLQTFYSMFYFMPLFRHGAIKRVKCTRVKDSQECRMSTLNVERNSLDISPRRGEV